MKDGIVISSGCFNLNNTFNNGQCFRWERLDEHSYGGVACGRFLKIIQEDNGVRLLNSSQADYENIWKNYFDLETDYEAVENSLRTDAIMETAVDAGHGMRILRQELWEVLISFIISQNNNISRIKKIVNNICGKWGEYIGEGYAFPTPGALAQAEEAELVQCGAGYRADYIMQAARSVDSGRLDLDALKRMDYSSAREILLAQKGIGPKVADCILLFGLHHLQAFPVDTWIKKAMCSLYMTPEARSPEIIKYASERFGKYAGMAQQYMFYAAREGRLAI